MTRAKRDEFLRHETVEVVRRRPITQRNMVMPTAGKPSAKSQRADDDAEVFGGSRDSAIVETPKRDRTPKGVADGRGKRSVKDMLLSIPTPEGRAIYAMERIASMEDSIVKVLDLCDNETREIIFKRRATIKERYGADFEVEAKPY